MLEGYLLLWDESGDEIHIDLISPEDFKKFDKADRNNLHEITYKPLIHWFTQTWCNEPWPFNNCKILGTISLPLGC